ncbi:alpha/beta hydrolase family esterase [Sulfurivermis fontis]|uniref:extracellular catalytic domain type 1 short-chain-length polyhydroxyalkanoate depolymerase n=1 Tax=Sulfurivermis fontis TaxID=1972068 RepID=UPI0018D57E24|nr:PHB depolymerase family esterase [Sulfurivermis fontis]
MRACKRVVGMLAICCAVLLPCTGFALDDSLRDRVKERMAERRTASGQAESVPAATPPGDHVYTLRHGGLERRYRLHVPTGYDAARPMPLLVALHGGGGNMDYQANDKFYGLISKSEREGFVVAFPNGYSRLRGGRLATWNAGRCCGDARDRNIDDVGFIRKMVAEIGQRVNVDSARIYATGMSNGGLMSYRLACEMADVFTAIAPVAGTDNTLTCSPARPVSVLHIHARDDGHVLFEGGAGPAAVDGAKITDFTSVADTVAKWVQLNGCRREAQRTLETAGVYCDTYSQCRGGAQVQLCVTEDGGHSWPGGNKPRIGAKPSRAISANDVMWEFFSRR